MPLWASLPTPCSEFRHTSELVRSNVPTTNGRSPIGRLRPRVVTAMTDSLSDSDLDSVRDVIDAATLRDIQFYEVSVRRNEDELEEDQAGNVAIEVQQHFGEGDFGVRLNAQVVVPAGEIVASVVAEYDLTEGSQPSKRALAIFAKEVAVMTVSRTFAKPWQPLRRRCLVGLCTFPSSSDGRSASRSKTTIRYRAQTAATWAW